MAILFPSFVLSTQRIGDAAKAKHGVFVDVTPALQAAVRVRGATVGVARRSNEI